MTKQEVANLLNAQLEKDGFAERVEIKFFKFEDDNGMRSYDVLMIVNPTNQHTIAITYNEHKLEWTLNYFGAESHLYCQTKESVLKQMYYEILLPLLGDKWAVAFGHKEESPCFGMVITCCHIPNHIEDNFTDKQRKLAKNFLVNRWSGEITDEKTICYITANAEKYLKLH